MSSLLMSPSEAFFISVPVFLISSISFQFFLRVSISLLTYKSVLSYCPLFPWAPLALSIIYMMTRSCWSLVMLSFSITLLIFCIIILSIVETGMLQTLNITLGLSTSPFSSISSASCILQLCCLVHRHVRWLWLLGGLTLSLLKNVSLSPYEFYLLWSLLHYLI